MTADLLYTMWSTIAEDDWPAQGRLLVVGVSGGPDSTALVSLLIKLNGARRRNWRLHLAHLNHGLRGAESNADAQFVRALAAETDCGCTVAQGALNDEAALSGRTLEEAARDQRYAFFERVLADTGAEVVATGHHADDHVETVLHRLIRGTGLRGLAGIPPVRPLRQGSRSRVIRPLLKIRREQLQAYLEAEGLRSCDDHTNQLLDFTRNRLRRELIPQLEQYNPAICDALRRLSVQARWVHEDLQARVLAQLPRLTLSDPAARPPRAEIVLDARGLLAQPRVLQTELVRAALATLDAGEKKLGFEHLTAVVELARRNISGKQLQLPGGVIVHYERGRLVFARRTA